MVLQRRGGHIYEWRQRFTKKIPVYGTQCITHFYKCLQVGIQTKYIFLLGLNAISEPYKAKLNDLFGLKEKMKEKNFMQINI